MTGSPPSTDRSAAPSASGLSAEGVTVRFGHHLAVDDVSLQVAPGEVVALIGPSGCGKSTFLRVLAGLTEPDAGRVRWDGDDLTAVAPHRRGFGLMFQDHALFPHRRVGENVAFGLRMAGASRPDISDRVAEVLELVGLDGYQDRTVDTLSGGEAQRVALARALAPSPRLLMLDEPLGSLDRGLRDRLAGDLRRLLTELGLAAIHVTHDQEEAYAVADRLAVMASGRIRRAGPVAEVWRRPGSAFTARFLGHQNVLDGAVARLIGAGDGTDAVVVPEAAITLLAPESAGAGWAATVEAVRFQGSTSMVSLRVVGSDGPVILTIHDADPPPVGSAVRVAIDPGAVVALPDRDPPP